MNKARKTLQDAKKAWESKKKQIIVKSKSKIVNIQIPKPAEPIEPPKKPVAGSDLEEVIIKVAEDIKIKKDELKQNASEELGQVRSFLSQMVQEENDKNRIAIEKQVKDNQLLENKIGEDIKTYKNITDTKLQTIKESIPERFDHKKADHSAITDKFKGLNKSIISIDGKIEQLGRKDETLQEKLKNLKIPAKHKDLKDIFTDDHHPELHIIETHPGLNATTDDLNRLVGGGNADDLHTHQALAQLLHGGGPASGGGAWGEITGTLSNQLDLQSALDDKVPYVMPHTTASDVGVIYKETDPFIHDFSHPTGGTHIPVGRNVFLGKSGNFTMGSGATSTAQASYNVGIGYESLQGLTTGDNNFVVGYQAMRNCTSAQRNVVLGQETWGAGVGTGYDNFAVGYRAMRYCTSAHNNVVFGNQA